jgi:hypothetical protein
MENGQETDLKMLARVLADTVAGPDELETAIEERLTAETPVLRESLSVEIKHLRRSAVQAALLTGCSTAIGTELTALIEDTLAEAGEAPESTADAILACESYTSLATAEKHQSDLPQLIGSCFAGRLGVPGDEECILAGSAMFAAIFGGTVGMLKQERLFMA